MEHTETTQEKAKYLREMFRIFILICVISFLAIACGAFSSKFDLSTKILVVAVTCLPLAIALFGVKGMIDDTLANLAKQAATEPKPE